MTPFRAPTVPAAPVYSYTRLGTSLAVEASGVVTCNPRQGAIVVLVFSIHASIATLGFLVSGLLCLLGVFPDAPLGLSLGLLGAGVAIASAFVGAHVALRRFWRARSVTFVPSEHALYTRNRSVPFSDVAGVVVARDYLSRDSRSLVYGPLQWLNLQLHDGTELRLCKAYSSHVPQLLQALAATGLPVSAKR